MTNETQAPEYTDDEIQAAQLREERAQTASQMNYLQNRVLVLGIELDRATTENEVLKAQVEAFKRIGGEVHDDDADEPDVTYNDGYVPDDDDGGE